MTMHYQISEEAYYSVETTRNQLRFIADLLTPTNHQLNQVNSTDMLSFVAAQHDALSAVLESASHHVESDPKAGAGPISADLLVRVIAAAVGHTTDAKELESLTDALLEGARVDAAYARAVQALDAARARIAPRPAARSKREKLTAGAA